MISKKYKKMKKPNQPDLTVAIGNLKLNTPLVCASGTFGFGDELKGLADFDSIGAITTKTITVLPKPGNASPRIHETACGIINSIGLENPGLKSFIREKLPGLKELKTKVIVSLGGYCLKDYLVMAAALEGEKRIAALELNLSCPNLKSKKLPAQSPKEVAKLTSGVRKLTKKTLIVKLTPEVTDITKVAKAAEAAGADAIALVNTYLALAIDTENKKPFLGAGYGGYSGPAIKPISLYKVWRAAQAVNIAVIGGGGISCGKDAVEFLAAGAKAVSLGTANLVCPQAAKTILQNLKQYMKKNQMADLSQLRSKFNV